MARPQHTRALEAAGDPYQLIRDDAEVAHAHVPLQNSRMRAAAMAGMIAFAWKDAEHIQANVIKQVLEECAVHAFLPSGISNPRKLILKAI